MAYARTRYVDIGMAAEIAYGSEQSSGFAYFPCEVTQPQLARNTVDNPARTATFGGRGPAIAGGKHGGTIELSFPLRGAQSGYDESSDAETAFPVERDLILSALGSGTANAPDANAYAATGMGTSSNAYTWELDTGADDAGKFLAADGLSFGFCSASASGATATYTIAQAGTDNTPLSNGDLLPSYTGFVSGEEMNSYTLRVVGEETEHGMVLIGCVPQSVTFSFEAGQVPTCSVTMEFTDHKIDDSIGGLQTQQARQNLPPVLSGANGRIVVGTASGGTKRCGMIAGSITIANEISAQPCFDKPGGMIAKRTDTTITMDLSAAWDSGDTVTSNEHEWEYLLDSGGSEAFGVYVGDAAGRIMGWFMPAGNVNEQPTLTDRDGILAWEFVATAGGPFEATHDAGPSGNGSASSIFLWGFA